MAKVSGSVTKPFFKSGNGSVQDPRLQQNLVAQSQPFRLGCWAPSVAGAELASGSHQTAAQVEQGSWAIWLLAGAPQSLSTSCQADSRIHNWRRGGLSHGDPQLHLVCNSKMSENKINMGEKKYTAANNTAEGK